MERMINARGMPIANASVRPVTDDEFGDSFFGGDSNVAVPFVSVGG